jgi:hypothetical protein
MGKVKNDPLGPHFYPCTEIKNRPLVPGWSPGSSEPAAALFVSRDRQTEEKKHHRSPHFERLRRPTQPVIQFFSGAAFRHLTANDRFQGDQGVMILRICSPKIFLTKILAFFCSNYILLGFAKI